MQFSEKARTDGERVHDAHCHQSPLRVERNPYQQRQIDAKAGLRQPSP